jgi:hypothetical protein
MWRQTPERDFIEERTVIEVGRLQKPIGVRKTIWEGKLRM